MASGMKKGSNQRVIAIVQARMGLAETEARYREVAAKSSGKN